MATTSKKTPKKAKPKPRAKSASASVARLKKTIAAQARDIREGAEQQKATSAILRMIARSPADLQSVLNSIAENAARLCDANDALVHRVDGDALQLVSHFGSIPSVGGPGKRLVFDRGSVPGRAIIDRQTIHVPDLPAAVNEFPQSKGRGIKLGVRTALATPLMRDGVPLGVIHIRRTEVRAFTNAQIKLFEIFADQAVIAIENARLFKELSESLEQQTATSEILGAIAKSPTDIQPVLDTIAENAAMICGANDAVIRLVEENLLRAAAHYGPVQGVAAVRPIDRRSPAGRAVLDRAVVHIPDTTNVTLDEFPETSDSRLQLGVGTFLAVPLLRNEVAIGEIHIRRLHVQPFTEKQIALLKTFADQAVIAIENIRLFNELQGRNRDLTEALEQQTATGEVLRVIASSPTELQPVLDTLLANAVKLSGATQGHIRQFDGEFLTYVSHFNESPELVDALNRLPQRPRPESMSTRALQEKTVVHVLDAQAEPNVRAPARQAHARTMLYVPLLREDTGIGTITIWRDLVEPFTERQIELVKTFADQGVIAIENVRLFNELEVRNHDLTEALEQQTATSEILRVISGSPTDIQPVMDTIATNAARLCEASDVHIHRIDGDILRLAGSYGSLPASRDREITRQSVRGRAVVDRKTIHVHDFLTDGADYSTSGVRSGARTLLATPLVREGVPIGVIAIRRMEVRPFSEKQIKLLETFADQAVIAIENVRLFQELKESLEQQTATSEILGVIASSPTDIQPVLGRGRRECRAAMRLNRFTDLSRSMATCSSEWRYMVRCRSGQRGGRLLAALLRASRC